MLIKRYALMTNLFMKCKRKKNRMFFGVSPIVRLISWYLNLDTWYSILNTHCKNSLQKGGVPATPSGTATLLRLNPSYQFYPRPLLAVTDFRYPRLPWFDGRCVQGPGTYSPRHGWCAITSESSFTESSCRLRSELGEALGISILSPGSSPLYLPL